MQHALIYTRISLYTYIRTAPVELHKERESGESMKKRTNAEGSLTIVVVHLSLLSFVHVIQKPWAVSSSDLQLHLTRYCRCILCLQW